MLLQMFVAAPRTPFGEAAEQWNGACSSYWDGAAAKAAAAKAAVSMRGSPGQRSRIIAFFHSLHAGCCCCPFSYYYCYYYNLLTSNYYYCYYYCYNYNYYYYYYY